jgi:hypothetical protein
MYLLVMLMLVSHDYSQRGFVESQATLYPEAAINDTAHVVGDVRLRHESFYKPWTSLQFAGAIELSTDTHHQTEREWRFDWENRGLQRPLLSLRRLSAQYYRRNLTVEAGKQFVRWGRTDIVNPTDRFAPRDFLTVVDNDFLAVDAVRGTFEHGSNTVDVVWSPRLTPSRTPLLSQRWFVPPPGAPSFIVERSIPEGSQSGIRWSHNGSVEFAAAFYSGFDHLPSYQVAPESLAVRQTYSKLRMIGGDVGIPLSLVSIKGEGAYFQSRDHLSDDYVLYVIQLERQTGEWFFVGGYGGEVITRKGNQTADFNPVRGLTGTILVHAGYTIDPNKSIAFEGEVRENFDGFWSKAEYSQAFGQHWRLTSGFTIIRGKPSDFLGQYHRNSHAIVSVRYSF